MKFLSQINVNTEYTLPFVDGNNGQVLTTDGQGAVYWGNVSAGATSLDGLTDVEITSPQAGQILNYSVPLGGTVPVWRNITSPYATIASPAFTGIPTAPTAPTSTDSTQIATTAFVKAQGYLSSASSINDLSDVTISTATTGQILQWSGTQWVNATLSTVEYVSKVQHLVKCGVAVTKGQAVYVTTSDGTNMIVGLASNATEPTSSKVIGLAASTGAINDQIFVVTEGLIAGLNTSTATAGDPVWLGTGGNLIFGLVNKPVAPAHLVYLGVVTRVQQNNGEIFVNVQNGFELNELHDVLISSPSAGQLIRRDSDGLWKNWSPNFLTSYTETDPIFVESPAYDITSTNITNWNAAYNDKINSASFSTSTGVLTLTQQDSGTITVDLDGRYLESLPSHNHDDRYYTETEIAGFFGGELEIAGYNATNWDTAYGWGNHATAGYLTSFTEADTLATVAARGNISNTKLQIQTAGNVAGGNLLLGPLGQGTTKWSYITSQHFYSTSEPEGFTLIGGLAQNGQNAVVIGGNIYESNPATEIQFWTHTSDTHSTGGTQRGIINSSGNWGIGTTSPFARLHVRTSTNEGTIAIGNEIYPGLIYSNAGTGEFRIDNRSSSAAGYITFFPNGQQNTVGSEAMRITTLGNVGINRASPSYKLDVAGNARFDNELYVGGVWSSSYGPRDSNGNINFVDWSSNVIARINRVSGVTSVGNRKLSMGILDINSQGTPEIRINTKIPFALGAADFTVNIKGFQYGGTNMMSLSIGWHYYLSQFYNETAISNGAFAPNITLAVDESNMVVIHLSNVGYWPKLYVESVYSSAYADDYVANWSWTDAGVDTLSSITPVAYKPLDTSITGNAAYATNAGNSTTTSQTNFSTLTVSNNTVATQAWVTSQGYLSGAHTHSASDITSGTLSTDRLPKQELGISIQGNFGQWEPHGTYTNLNTDVAYWGWSFVQGNTNAPHSGSQQWYRGRFSLGDAYGNGSAGGDYWMEIAIPRYNQGSNSGNLFVRTCENGTINGWQGVRAAFATDADTLDGQHGSYYQAVSSAINTSNIGSQSVAYAGEAGFVSNQGGQLLRFDNRIISPSETNAGYLQFGFTSWANNNTGVWADYLHLRSYTDGSGGNDNLVMFKKDGIGMRIWQQSFGSTTAYSSYADVWTTGDFSSTNVSNWNAAYNDRITAVAVSGTGTKTLTLTQQDGGTLTATWTDYDTDNDAQTLSWDQGQTLLSISGGNDITLTGLATEDYVNSQGFVTSSGTVAGVVRTVTGTNSAELVRGNMGDNDQARILVGATASNAGYLEIATADDGTEPIYVRQYTGTFTTEARTATLLDGSGNTTFPGTVTAGRYRGHNSIVLNNYTTVNPSSNVFLYSQPNDRDAWIFLDSADTGSNWGIYHRQIDSAVGDIPANSIGFVGGGSSTLQAYISLANGDAYFRGNLTIGGTFTENSSIRFKENIQPLEPALAKVEQLNPVTYTKITSQEEEIGLIAEEVAELFPEVVTYNESGQPQGIQYQRLSVILLKAVQELTERVNKLENK